MPPGDSGWFKATRGDALEVIAANPLAYVLAAVIAHRARWSEGFNRHGLALGEALLGDYEKYGMSERQYRTAKEQLEKWGFATFRATNKGTIGKLIDTRLFSIRTDVRDEPADTQATGSRRTADGQPTTNKEGNKNIDNTLSPAERPYPEPVWPCWNEWWGFCQTIGLPEWRARSEWDKQESLSPKWKGIGDWQAHSRRVKGWWEQDGSPLTPSRNGAPAQSRKTRKPAGVHTW